MKDCEEIREWYQEQRQRKERSRMDYCKRQIEALGYPVTVYPDGKKLTFELNGNTITVFPYKGWCTGKGIKDGRGIQNLLNRLRKERRQRLELENTEFDCGHNVDHNPKEEEQ